MWSDFKRGVLPVPDLRNLDIYHDIGVELDLTNIETISDDAYLALYREKLANWNIVYPITPDTRLWPEVELDINNSDRPRAVA